MQNPSDFLESGKEWLQLAAGLWKEQQFLVLTVLHYLECVSPKKREALVTKKKRMRPPSFRNY